MVSWKTPIVAALVCAHCALTALAVAAAAGLAALPTFFGVNLALVLPPILILGVFAGWVFWSGRAKACDVPERPS